jgi:murein DD-endopeptidase MepM/ murein hydrolase activator NlpD
MRKKRKVLYGITLIPLIFILCFFGWFFTIIFEGEKPAVGVTPRPEYLVGNQTFTLSLKDMKRGLKTVKVYVEQEGRQRVVFEEKFPFEGLLNRNGIHHYGKEITIDPAGLNLAQGRLDLKVSVWDYSRRGGGDGNRTLFEHRMIVDTIPPAIRPVSRMHNINKGGACMAIYQSSSDTAKSGVFVDDLFFPGFPSETASEGGIHECYFALPHDVRNNPTIHLWAEDKAGNSSETTFYTHVRKKRFRSERINITDRFLKNVLPYFSSYLAGMEASDIEKYVKINNDLRKENHAQIAQLKDKTTPKQLWEGTWGRLKNAATMSRYADHRSYYYKGKKVDEQVHLGVDLASLANSPVQAANSGKVIFAERLGIYGLTVVLDHGQGLASLYGHLSRINVSAGQEMEKGDTLGLTGQTGLAGGDHLHFSIMVHGVFVNPIEWWDGHWIHDNITIKLAGIRGDEK